jgi:hypothetical protein
MSIKEIQETIRRRISVGAMNSANYWISVLNKKLEERRLNNGT